MKAIKEVIIDSIGILQWVLAVVTLFMVYMVINQVQDLDKLGRENNTYVRTVGCILSVPLADRTDDYISNCYLLAEKHNEIDVDHFGNK